jgi:hypothetical protein
MYFNCREFIQLLYVTPVCWSIYAHAGFAEHCNERSVLKYVSSNEVINILSVKSLIKSPRTASIQTDPLEVLVYLVSLPDQFSCRPRVSYRSVSNSLEGGNETYVRIKFLITMSVKHSVSLILTLPLSTAMLYERAPVNML